MTKSKRVFSSGLLYVAIALTLSIGLNLGLLSKVISDYTRYKINKVVGADDGDILLVSPRDSRNVAFLLGDSRVLQWSPLPNSVGLHFVNAGVGGETTRELVRRVRGFRWPENVHLVVLASGINDVTAIALAPHLKEQIVNNALINIHQIIRLIKQNDIDVLLLGIVAPARPELLRRLVWDGKIYSDIREVNRQLESIAGKERISFINPNLTMTDPEGILQARFSIDTLHFSQSAYQHLNRLIELEQAENSR